MDVLTFYIIAAALFGLAAAGSCVAAGLASNCNRRAEKNFWRATWAFVIVMLAMTGCVIREVERQECRRREACEQAGGIYLHRDNLCVGGIIQP